MSDQPLPAPPSVSTSVHLDATAAPALLAMLLAIVAVRLATLGAYPLFDDTEARYALIGLVMLETGNWITPQLDAGVPFWAKPPLSVWGTAISISLFGANAFAARLPSFLFVAGSGVLVYLLAAARHGHAGGLLAAIVFASSALTFYLAGGVMTDPPLLFGVTLTLAAYWRAVAEPPEDAAVPRLWAWLFFVGVAISLLAKGPIGAILPGLAVFAWMVWKRRWRETFTRLPWITGTLLVLVLVVPWYIAAELKSPGFLRYFFIGEHFERFVSMGWTGDLYGRPRRHPHGTIWVLGIAAMLPWSLLALAAPFWGRLRAIMFSREMLRDPWLAFLLCWHLTAFLFFTVPRGVLITYVAMSLPSFALLAAHVLARLGAKTQRRLVPGFVAVVPAAVVLLAAALMLRLDGVADRLPSQAAIIAAFEAERGAGEARLVYVGRHPFSARFYSGNRAGYVATPEDLARLLDTPGTHYVAIDRHRFERLAEPLAQRLELRAEHGGTLLLRQRPG